MCVNACCELFSLYTKVFIGGGLHSTRDRDIMGSEDTDGIDTTRIDIRRTAGTQANAMERPGTIREPGGIQKAANHNHHSLGELTVSKAKDIKVLEGLDALIPDGTIFRTECSTRVDTDAEKAHEHTLAFDLSGLTIAELAELATRSTSPVVDWQRRFRADRIGTGKKAPKLEMPEGGEVVILAKGLVDRKRARKGMTLFQKVALELEGLTREQRIAALEKAGLL